jgi:hypothetical protein
MPSVPGCRNQEKTVQRTGASAFAFPIEVVFFRHLRESSFELDSQGEQIEQWEFCGQVFVRRELGLQSFWQSVCETILCDPHWLGDIAQCALSPSQIQ